MDTKRQDTAIPTDRVLVTTLDSADAFTWRGATGTVTQVSDRLPMSRQDAAIGALLRAVHGAPGPYATASFALGAAAAVPSQRGVRPVRR